MRYGISFVLPMFNEAENIRETLRRVSALGSEICDDYEVIAVDDGSTDGCGDIVRAAAQKDGRVRMIRLERNTKFGGALKAGLKNAAKETIVYTDSDMPVKEHDVKEALKLLDEADIVTGYSLALKDASLKRIFISKLYNFFIGLFFGLRIRDINSGFKIYKKKVFEGMALISESPFIDVEIFSEAAKRNFKIAQYGLIFELRTKGKSTISRFSVLARTFWDMLVYRFWRMKARPI